MRRDTKAWGGFLSLLLALPTAALAQRDWALGSCDLSKLAAGRANVEQRIRAAEPSSPDWVPHPFPTKPHEIMEDALELHRRIFSDAVDAELAEGDRRLFALADRDELRWTVVRVADWTPTRCDPRVSRDGDWLVRFFSAKTGEEVTRVLVHDSGMIGQLAHSTPEFSFPELPSLEVPSEQRAALVDVDPSSVQYVTLWGPLQCDVMTPCAAWKAGRGVVILRANELLRVTESSERLSFSQQLRAESKNAVAERIHAEGRRLISLGGDLWAAADSFELGQVPTAKH